MKNFNIFTKWNIGIIILFIFFFLTRIAISAGFLSTFLYIVVLSDILDVGIVITSAIAISIILIPHTYEETKRIERDEYFKLLYEEIDLIRTKIPQIPNKIKTLKESWKSFKKEQWIQNKHPILFPYSSSTRFFYQYLPNNAFQSIINRGFIREIKGFNSKSEDDQYHMISYFYLKSKNTSEFSQRIEDWINICIDNRPNDNIPSKFFKLHGIVFKWLDSKTIKFTDISEIDSQGNPIGFQIKTWDEFVEYQCSQIIKLFDELQKKIDERILNYKDYQDFYQDIINEEDITQSASDPKEKKFGLSWPLRGYFILFLILLFPMIAFFWISIYFSIIVILLFIAILLIVYFSLVRFRKEPTKKGLGRVFISIIVIWLLFQIIIIGCVEIGIFNTKIQYNKQYSDLLSNNHGDELNATWGLVNFYLSDFSGKYGQKDAIIPSRIFTDNYIPYVNPLFQIYFFNDMGLNKIILLQRGGNCGEFSNSVALLLNISTNHETRVISMQGADHGFPEVKIYQKWWVVDKIYTTPEKPIDAIQFSNYIPQDLNSNIANLESSLNESDILEQHGYSYIDLKVTVIKNMIANHLDDELQENAIVEVFLLTNSSADPLISRKNTDKSGNCHIRLVGGKKYLISVKKNNMIGLEILNTDFTSNQSSTVYLHKYQ